MGFDPITTLIIQQALKARGIPPPDPAAPPQPLQAPQMDTLSGGGGAPATQYPPIQLPDPTISPPAQRFLRRNVAPPAPPAAPQTPPQAPEQGYGAAAALASPQEAPPAPIPAPEASPAAPAQSQAPQPPGAAYFRRQYGWPQGFREDLAKAQAEDRDLMRSAQAGVSGNIAQMSVTGIPIDTQHNFARVGQATRQFIERSALEQDEPALIKSQADADSSIVGAEVQRAMMTPGHPAFRSMVAGALKEDPTLREFGITEESPMWQVAQAYAQRKPADEHAQSRSITAKNTMDAEVLAQDIDPNNPAIPMALQVLKQVNPQAAKMYRPGMTMKQLAAISGPAVDLWKARMDVTLRNQAFQLDVQKYRLDYVGKVGAPPGWRTRINPATQMPYRILGDTEKAQVAESAAAAVHVNDILDKMDGLIDKRNLTNLDPGPTQAAYAQYAAQLKVYVPKLWGQQNEKYSKSFDQAINDIVPTGKGTLWILGEDAAAVKEKIKHLRQMTSVGQRQTFAQMGLEPDYGPGGGGVPPGAVKVR